MIKTFPLALVSVAIVALVLFPEMASADARPVANDATVDLPMEQLKSGQVVIPLSTRGQKDLLFILDTGANMSAITSAAVKQLGFRDDEGRRVNHGPQGATRLLRIDQYEIGRHVFNTIVVAVIDFEQPADSPKVAGVLGQTFFEAHDVEFDFSKRRMRLRAAGSLRNRSLPKATAELRFTEIADALKRSTGTTWPIVEVTLDRKTIQALVDTGADHILINEAAAAKFGADKKAPHSFTSLRLGSVTFARPNIAVADSPAFEIMGLRDRPAMIVAPSALAGSVVEFSFATARLRVTAEQ
jgi:predicted aspartyl protease